MQNGLMSSPLRMPKVHQWSSKQTLEKADPTLHRHRCNCLGASITDGWIGSITVVKRDISTACESPTSRSSARPSSTSVNHHKSLNCPTRNTGEKALPSRPALAHNGIWGWDCSCLTIAIVSWPPRTSQRLPTSFRQLPSQPYGHCEHRVGQQRLQQGRPLPLPD